jgi:hypothetical protein
MSLGEEHESGTSRPIAISHAEMNAAIEQGDAAPLSQSHGWLTRFLDAWWVEYEGGWLRVIDEPAVRELEQVAARLAEANAITAADTAERLSGEPEQADDGEDAVGGQRRNMESVKAQRHLRD